MKYIYLLSGIVLFSFIAKSSQKYTIPELGSIEISDALELQTGEVARLVDSTRTSYKVALDHADYRYVFQQKGLNLGNQEAKKQYCRLNIKTYFEEARSMSDLNSITPQEILNVSNEYETGLRNQFINTPVKMVKYLGTNVVRINGAPCLRASYTRTINNEDLVMVSIHTFFNTDRVHYITTSYRMKEQDRWKPVLENSLNSLKITIQND